jgi:hypothetical protein
MPRHIMLDAMFRPTSLATELWLARSVYLSRSAALLDAPAEVRDGFA